jgi:hypothetical protein
MQTSTWITPRDKTAATNGDRPRKVAWLVVSISMVGIAGAARSGTAGIEEASPIANEIVLRQGLACPPAGRSGRSPLREDAIEAQVVAGKWVAPKDGDAISAHDTSVRRWQLLEAAEDGQFSHRILAGGYLFCTVPSDERRVMLLEAAGHAVVYVNGEPRTGDPYQHGYVRVPVELQMGSNEFLFQVSRGRLRAKLVPPRGAAQLDLSDSTVPDLVTGEPVEALVAVVVMNTTSQPLQQLVIEASVGDNPAHRTQVPALVPLSSRKVGFSVRAPALADTSSSAIKIRWHRRLGLRDLAADV